MADYFVDSVAGNDANAGTSSGAPFQTLAAVNALTLTNKTVVLKRGSTFTGTGLVLANNGTVVDVYGSGAAPIIRDVTTGAQSEANPNCGVKITGSSCSVRNLYLTTTPFMSDPGYVVLNGAINASVTTIPITLVSGQTAPPSTSGTILVDSEKITYTGFSGGSLTGCVRGALSTTAASHLTAAHCNMIGGVHAGPFPTAQPRSFDTGIRIDGNSNLVESCEATGLWAGISIFGGSGGGNTVQYCNLHDNLCMGNLSTANTSDDSGAFQILLKGDNNIVAYNTLSGASAWSYDYGRDGSCMEFSGASGNSIHHNIGSTSVCFAELAKNGATPCANNTFAYNLYYNTTAFTDTDGSTSFRISIFDAKGSGSGSGPVTGSALYNNTFYSSTNSNGVEYVAPGAGESDLTMINNIVIVTAHTVFIGSATPVENHNCFRLTGGGSGVTMGQTLDATSTSSDPLFTSAGTDFTLQSGSPCKDTGSSVPAGLGWTTDLNGITVPVGGTADMGCYERAPRNLGLLSLLGAG